MAVEALADPHDARRIHEARLARSGPSVGKKAALPAPVGARARPVIVLRDVATSARMRREAARRAAGSGGRARRERARCPGAHVPCLAAAIS